MNYEKIKNYQIFSIIFVFILGTFLHFLYDLSNQNQIIAIFSSVNESVWEHLKLLFFPMLLTIFIGYFFFRNDFSAFICAKTIGILISLAFTIIFFYTYTGILGRNISFIDIGSFFIATLLGELTSSKLMHNNFKCNSSITKIILIALLFCFIFFTFNTPNIGLFKDPITGKYGI